MPVVIDLKTNKQRVLSWNDYKKWKQKNSYTTISTKSKKKRKTPKRNDCEIQSPIYKEIFFSKHNREELPNGDIRIGNEYAVCKKTDIIYKLTPQEN